ncbi:MAG: ComEA family DNA-binding protein [Gammaproteobacteria bacterium]|nr:ComEA family DNA-binding protein [Gammaproteobacteria bacterium]
MQPIRSIILFCILVLSAPLAWGDSVNINTANTEELVEVLTNIGPKKAKAIVDYRKKNGSFKSAEDLTKVKGIGEATVKKNRGKIRVSGKAMERNGTAGKSGANKAKGKSEAGKGKSKEGKKKEKPKKDKEKGK